jgi:hypothetical protein
MTARSMHEAYAGNKLAQICTSVNAFTDIEGSTTRLERDRGFADLRVRRHSGGDNDPDDSVRTGRHRAAAPS